MSIDNRLRIQVAGGDAAGDLDRRQPGHRILGFRIHRSSVCEAAHSPTLAAWDLRRVTKAGRLVRVVLRLQVRLESGATIASATPPAQLQPLASVRAHVAGWD